MNWNDELIKSASQGNLEKVKECLANGVSANVGNGWALRNASQNGYFEIVKYLVENGANVNAEGKYCGTAIELAKNDGISAFLEKNKN